MADFLQDLSGLNVAAGAFKGFAEAMQDGEDRKMKKMELEARLKAQDEQRERQKYLDGLATRHEGFQVPEGEIYKTNPSDLKYDPEYLKLQEQKLSADPYGLKGLQVQNARAELSKKNTEASQTAKGFKLPPDKVLQVQQGAQIPKMLDDIEATLKYSSDKMGPVQGRLGAINAYDTEAQTIDAQMRAAAQSFGRLMEGGVLRKEDEEKYRKMFPNLDDTPEVAKNKLAIVRRLLVGKQNGDISALRAQGYDTSGFQPLPSSEVPGLLTKKKGLVPQGLLQPSATESSPAATHPQDSEAVQWAKKNPSDPRSVVILRANGL